jgi:predicted RNA binding protein YcfA (HicA-like mRNA interferase family)
LKVRDIIRRVEKDGWVLVRQRGSHRQYNHPGKAGTVTIAGKPGDESPTGTVKSIFKQAQIEEV